MKYFNLLKPFRKCEWFISLTALLQLETQTRTNDALLRGQRKLKATAPTSNPTWLQSIIFAKNKKKKKRGRTRVSRVWQFVDAESKQTQIIIFFSFRSLQGFIHSHLAMAFSSLEATSKVFACTTQWTVVLKCSRDAATGLAHSAKVQNSCCFGVAVF